MVNFIHVLNLIQLFLSYVLSNFIRKPIIWGTPAFVSIEPTNHCNLRCPECPTGQSGLTRATGNLRQEDFNLFIDQLSPHLAYLTLYFQGEPYLNKDLFRFISYARSRRIYVWTSTNGHYFTKEYILKTIDAGLNKLIVSLDGTDQQSYEQYRIGGSFETVVTGIKDFVRIRKEMSARKPLLEIQFLVLKSNQHQINEIKKLGKLLGVNRMVLKKAQFYDFEQGNPLMPEEGQWSRYKRTSEQADKRTDGGFYHHDTMTPKHHGTTTSRQHDTTAPLHNDTTHQLTNSPVCNQKSSTEPLFPHVERLCDHMGREGCSLLF